MTHFLLFFKRDLKHIFKNPRLLLLPFGFFGLSLFLIYFMGSHEQHLSTSPSLYWVLFILSTMGALGQNIARDYEVGFLQALQGERISLSPYIFAKASSLLCAWAFPFWMFLVGADLLQGNNISPLKTLGVIASVSIALGFLYCLFDGLFLQGKSSPFLGLILLVPFVLPLLILGNLGLETEGFQALLPVFGYALFLSSGAFFMTQKLICR